MTDKLCFSITEAAEQLSIGKNHIIKYINSGDLPSFKLGQRRLINREALDEFRLSLQENYMAESKGG